MDESEKETSTRAPAMAGPSSSTPHGTHLDGETEESARAASCWLAPRRCIYRVVVVHGKVRELGG